MWKRGTVTDIWTGKVGEREICIKAFRPVANMDQKKLKKVGRVSLWKNRGPTLDHPGTSTSRGGVEARFAF